MPHTFTHSGGSKMKRILAIGAHFDDVELGCGGTLARHAAAGNRVTVCVVTDSGYSDPKGREIRSAAQARREGEAAAALLGYSLICLNLPTFGVEDSEALTGKLTALIEDLQIDTLYTHWDGDTHRDHRNTALCSIMAGRRTPRFLMYLSNFCTGSRPFHPAFYVDITDFLEIKLKALSAHGSELSRVNHVWMEQCRNRHALDGAACGVPAAEAFQVLRYRMDF